MAALGEDGITVPFPVQAATLPDALAGVDILGRAQTGSGKTLGFCIPLVARLAGGYTMACRPRGLVLAPTRELATQVQAVLSPLADALGLSVAAVFGGTPQSPQVAALRNSSPGSHPRPPRPPPRPLDAAPRPRPEASVAAGAGPAEGFSRGIEARREGKSRVVSKMLLRTPAAVTTEK